MRRLRAAVVIAVAAVIGTGCGPKQAAAPTVATPTAQADTRIDSAGIPVKNGEHEPAHGGVLNAIVECEIGHVEVKRAGDTLNVWFVGGAPDTTKAVQIPNEAVTLNVTLPSKRTETLALKPEPLDLAGETVRNCSRFAGSASWLSGAATFTATGNVTFKGQRCPLRIEYPNGYDPD